MEPLTTYPDGLVGAIFALKLHLLLTEKRRKTSKNEDQTYIQVVSTLSLLYNIDLINDETITNICHAPQFQNLVDNACKLLTDQEKNIKKLRFRRKIEKKEIIIKKK